MDSVTIRVTGGRELRRHARDVGGPERKKALRQGHKDIATDVAGRAADYAPKRTRALARTVRGLGSLSKAQVAAGRGRINDYAGVIHYGHPARNILATMFVTDAVADEMSDSRQKLEDLYLRISRRLDTT